MSVESAPRAEGERLSLFEGFGVELEYMVVDAETLDVSPTVDRLIEDQSGEVASEVEVGEISWSNELVLHVVELKTNGPAAELEPLPERFQASVGRAGELLERRALRLLPTAMHPWMDPATETRLWPHEYSRVYETYDRIFTCQGHGWSNLQSAHLNLPFANDEEFGKLHAAIRVVLPLLPAIAASSPIADGRVSRWRDYRMEVYRTNSARVPEVAGLVVPEPAFSEGEYRERIFEPMMRAMAPLDPARVLEQEFLNSRGAIARFGRGSVEIRVVDVQECPLADVAIVAATVSALRALVEERHASRRQQRGFDTGLLAGMLRETTRHAELAGVDSKLAEALGRRGARDAAQVWEAVIESGVEAGTVAPLFERPLEHLLSRGTLSTRILRALGLTGGGEASRAGGRAAGAVPMSEAPSRQRLRAVYGELADCLAAGRLFG
ncbi:MAG TPA: glutamate-cysteine ligase family protein [Thermoanaerobaculia bacterium]|nr:glutamate-cysteine ligase family protein [Thermoanaerobaculia bacterium]